MGRVLRFSLMFTAFVVIFLGRPQTAELAEQMGVRGNPLPLEGSSVVAEGRFVDNGNGTMTDTRKKIMWQKGDNGKEVAFEEAQEYCKTLRLGGYADWRLPDPEESDTAVAVELMMRMHSRDTYAHFDLYWSSDPTVLLPFNYRPSLGKEVSRTYPTPKKRPRAFVRAVRSLETAKPGA
ncbi:MAG TPA: DUF1566 domain-containing protein [Thermodesulfobacteriota bacterium]|jgi:hypothetical protein|nr:DUF1566 domain-containing protein [Thermodesulfobacteriota bacterium]